MSLHTIDRRRIDPEKAEQSTHVQNAVAKLHPRTFDKVCRTIDEEIQNVVDSGRRRFAWMNTGSLVGNGSSMPHEWHHHLWNAVFGLFPKSADPVAEKGRRITVGALIKWRTSLRDEPWIVHYRETGKEDVVTGDEIYAGEYWISPDGIRSMEPKPRKKRPTIADLTRKWNNR